MNYDPDTHLDFLFNFKLMQYLLLYWVVKYLRGQS